MYYRQVCLSVMVETLHFYNAVKTFTIFIKLFSSLGQLAGSHSAGVFRFYYPSGGFWS